MALRIFTSARTALGYCLAPALALGIGASTAHAQSIKIGCSPTPDCVAAMIATDDGIFKKHGLDAEMVVIALNSNIPAALTSNSLQFGGPTPTVLLQAIDGGLELAAVANAAAMSKSAADSFAIVAKPEAHLHGPKDFPGKRVAVPGFNALLHVLLRQWLILGGVDPKAVQFVEGTFPAMGDMLKGGSVDAVILVEPFLSRVTAAKTGVVVANYLETVPEGEALIIFAADRRWAEANPKVVAAFRASVAEGAKIAAANPDRAREAAAKFLKLPPPAAATIKPGNNNPAISAKQISWWLDVMNRQNMLQTKIDPARVLLK